MNAVICICHFCEAHGPCVLFGTGVLNEIDVSSEQNCEGNICNACTSIGYNNIIISKSPDGITYCSRQKQSSEDLNNCLQQAAFRSLSCEASPTKEGGCFYFGDSNRGNVMSYAFQMKDSLARGLKRWFSIIITMKDRMYLLNLMIYLLEHIQVVTKELQTNAEVNYEKDQKLCSQRALRLQTGKIENTKPRSLMELTDNQDIYNYLHQSFARILDIARQTYSETLHTSLGIINVRNKNSPENISDMSLRKLKDAMGLDIFSTLLYCVLTGVQVIVRAEMAKGLMIINCLSKLIPNFPTEHKSQSDHIIIKNKLVCCELSVDIPLPCSMNTCGIDIENDSPVLNWPGGCPQKYPTLMKHILNAVEERKMNETVLSQHLIALQEEWMGIATTIKTLLNSPEGPNNVGRLKQVLGVKPEDENILQYWIQF